MKRLTIVAALCASMCAIAPTTVFSEDDNSDVDSAFKAWGDCLFFEAQKSIRAYGESSSPEELADLSFLSCNEMQNGFKHVVVDQFENENSRQKALQIYKETEIKLHGELVGVIRKMVSNEP